MTTNSKIWFIVHETEFGPFFSTKDKAIAYVKTKLLDDEEFAVRGQDVVEGNDPYVNIVEVKLDNEDCQFDG